MLDKNLYLQSCIKSNSKIMIGSSSYNILKIQVQKITRVFKCKKIYSKNFKNLLKYSKNFKNY